MSGHGKIHINGQDYDASSGSPLNKPTPSIDGIHRVHHAATAHHHATHRSTTLLRSAVKKPHIISDISHKPIEDMLFKPKPIKMAEHIHIKKSPDILHFSPIEPRMIDLEPVAEPVLAYPGEETLKTSPKKVISHEDHITKQLAVAESHKQPLVNRKKSVAKKIKHAVKHKKARSLASGVAILVLIGGFIVFQNVPGISMIVASRRAGFSAALPKYTPSGFSFNGPVDYGLGRVVISFDSNSDDRSYEIEQTKTDLSSSELKKQLAGESGNKFQTISQEGQTIYLSNDKAVWVNDGIKYSLKGNSGLSSAQIASIAASL